VGGNEVVGGHEVELSVFDPGDPWARFCVRAYFSELASRFEGGFEPERSIPATDDEMRPPNGLFVVAVRDGEPVGCAGLKLHGDAPAEMKRLWVAGDMRGTGLGRRLMEEIESQASAHGAQALRLDTNRSLTEAIAMYRGSGYREIPAFNSEPYADFWFEKVLRPGER
jgi:GNAT superfamily N-acetyltransferase